MRLVLIVDHYPPQRSSAAVQMSALAHTLDRAGHDVTVLTPDPALDVPHRLDDMDGISVLRVRRAAMVKRARVKRAVIELLTPWQIRRAARRAGLDIAGLDGIVWYSPPIVYGPLVRWLKSVSGAPAYLILRDIFPEWAADLGIMSRGAAYRFFKIVERHQYRQADMIGVQSPANLDYFESTMTDIAAPREVLQNWSDPQPAIPCSLDLSNGPLAGRCIAVYAGNMGKAQGLGVIIDLADRWKQDFRAGFVFVGRGEDRDTLEREAQARNLTNIVFHDEIAATEIPSLYRMADIGLVCLDVRLRTHNVPGKFISYMQNGLPTLAFINTGNDLGMLIKERGVGWATSNPEDLDDFLETALDEWSAPKGLETRKAACLALAEQIFRPEIAAEQILNAFEQAS